MSNGAKRNLVAQWAFDTRPVLLRFHLWLDESRWSAPGGAGVGAYVCAARDRTLSGHDLPAGPRPRLFGEFGAAPEGQGGGEPGEEGRDAVSAYV